MESEKKSLAEEWGVTYTEGPDGMLYPDVVTGIDPEVEARSLGKYGRMRERFLKENRPIKWELLLGDGKLKAHLLQVEDESKAMLEILMKQLQQQYPAPDRGTQPVEWAGHMNNLKAQAEEVIYRELIYK